MADYLGKKIKFNIEDNDLQKIRFNKVYGESQQATRSGKNFAILGVASGTIGKVPFIVDKGTININGTTISGHNNYYFNSFRVRNSGVATFWIEITGYTDKPSKNASILLQESSDNSTWSIAKEISCNSTVTKQYQVTLDNSKYYRIGFYTTEDTFTNATIKIQLEYGTNKTEFEEAGASPSPDYPSEIENLEGKNKFNHLWFDTAKEVDWTAYQNILNGAKAIPIFIGKGNVATFSSDIPLLSDNNLLFAINNLAESSSAFFAAGKTRTIRANNEGYVYVGYVKSRTNYNKVKDGTYYVQVEEGSVATPYVPYNSLEIKNVGENLFNPSNAKDGYVTDNSGQILGVNIKNKNTNYIKIDGGEKYFILSNKLTGNWGAWYDKDKKFISGITLGGKNKGIVTAPNNAYFINFTVSYENNNPDYANNVMIARSDKEIPYKPYQEQKVDFPLCEGQKLMEGSYLADDGIHHVRKQVVFDGSNNRAWYMDSKPESSTDYFYTRTGITTENIDSVICSHFKKGSSSRQEFWATTVFCITVNKTVTGIISSDTAVQRITKFKTWLSEQYANGTPVIVEYELAEEEIVSYTEEQKEAWEKLRHFKGLNGENNITAEGTLAVPTLDLTLYNVAEEDFDIYISKKGYFGALKYDINNLIDFMESNIPSIAEATESSVKIAGRDGDVPLNTVYEPLSFEIVCYTEDNLTPEEKIIEEQKITSLLNSIKNQTKTLFMEREKKFYKVKYSGNLSVVRYPKHLKFTIPLKSSESYAMNCEESEIIGNGIKVSNTIKDTGAIFTIKGPAIKPIISLNNYQMKYNENILEGNSLIINSEDSTITHITSAGVKTNAMRAYNHEFPKIKNGENQLAVSSGIDDENQVNVKWYDLKI